MTTYTIITAVVTSEVSYLSSLLQGSREELHVGSVGRDPWHMWNMQYGMAEEVVQMGAASTDTKNFL